MSDKTEQISIAELGARFAQIRKKMKFTQKDVGDELGLPQKKVSSH
jgi:transcriptional regulator with XRE-family HTH domain